MPALEIFAAAVLLLGTVLVFRVVIEADRLDEAEIPLEVPDTRLEDTEPLRQAA